jgi:cytochrome c peroxidase
MHDGRFSNLDQVVAQYNLGGLSDPNRSNEIKPLNLSAQQRADLVEYLKALTSPVKIIIPINNNPANTIEQLGAGL